MVYPRLLTFDDTWPKREVSSERLDGRSFEEAFLKGANVEKQMKKQDRGIHTSNIPLLTSQSFRWL